MGITFRVFKLRADFYSQVFNFATFFTIAKPEIKDARNSVLIRYGTEYWSIAFVAGGFSCASALVRGATVLN